jgi:SAM-dependent methyltransferase
MTKDAKSAGLSTCPICGEEARFALSAGDYHYGNPGRFSLYGCRACRHHFQDPMPDAAELAGYYPQGYYAHQPPETDLRPRGLRRRGIWLMSHYLRLCRGYRHLGAWPNPILALLGRWLIGSRRSSRAPRYVTGGTACDFGCGAGAGVAWLRYVGWQAEGIEFSAGAVAAGRKAGLTITPGSTEVLEARPAAFDWIQSFHCVEHVPDVGRLFRAFFHAMRPGGTLAVEVPNADSRQMRIYGEAYYYLTLPVHLHIFSHASLGQLARQSGFADVRIQTWSAWASQAESWLLRRDLRRGTASPRFGTHGPGMKLLATLGSLGGFLMSRGGVRGDCLTLICRRPPDGENQTPYNGNAMEIE